MNMSDEVRSRGRVAQVVYRLRQPADTRPTDTPLVVTSPAAILPVTKPPPATTVLRPSPSPRGRFADQGRREALLKMLPEQAGFVWNYDGSLESGHEMALSVTPQDGAKVYTITERCATCRPERPDRSGTLRSISPTPSTIPYGYSRKRVTCSSRKRPDRDPPCAGGGREMGQFVEYDTGGTVRSYALESAQKTVSIVHAVRYEDKTTGYEDADNVGTGITAFERSTDDRKRCRRRSDTGS